MHQIERARRAAILLQEGISILDTAYELGYFDHAHLTKSLKHFIGQTPTQLIDQSKAEQLSLLYKTDAFSVNYDTHIDDHQQRRAVCEK
jgi:AraC-like DNA-binding protein